MTIRRLLTRRTAALGLGAAAGVALLGRRADPQDAGIDDDDGGGDPAIELEARFPADGASGRSLRLLSSTDLELMEPIIAAFRTERPEIGIVYQQAASADVFTAVRRGAPVDLAISSAMDLQTKLANDGYARTWSSAATRALPDWAVWRDEVIAFTEEPAVTILSPRAFPDPSPDTRAELIRRLRAEPERFVGRVATYDARRSGLGYLFASQDAQVTDAFWRLMAAFGDLEPQLAVSSSDMIDSVVSGRVDVAYNVLGSYAERRRRAGDALAIVEPADVTQIMLRSALIPLRAADPEAAGAFIDFLLSDRARILLETRSAIRPVGLATAPSDGRARPIRLGPGLLVYLDPIKRAEFLEAWTRALTGA